jgi:hypothetical protein
VKQLDSDLGAAVNDLAMLLGVVAMRMQQRTYAAVDQIAAALEHSKAAGRSSSGGGGASEAATAAAVADAAGLSREEAAKELSDLKNVRLFLSRVSFAFGIQGCGGSFYFGARS